MAIDGTGERRQGNLAFEPDTGVLVVGGRTAVLDQHPEPREVVGTYVELVAAQREVVPLTHIDLRNRELVQLSSLLELPQDELDDLIDRELVRLLSGSAGTAPVSGAALAAAGGWSAKRRLYVFGGLTVAALAGAIGVAIASQTSTVELPGSTATGGGTVEVIELEGGGTATRTESDPAPVGEDGTDVGSAVVLERNP